MCTQTFVIIIRVPLRPYAGTVRVQYIVPGTIRQYVESYSALCSGVLVLYLYNILYICYDIRLSSISYFMYDMTMCTPVQCTYESLPRTVCITLLPSP